MRINPLDLIDTLNEYVIVVYGIYYKNGYPDIPMWLQEETSEEISFFTVICGIGLCPDDQLERCGRTSLETLYGAMFLKNQHRWWVEALSRTRINNKAPVVIDPRPRCIFVGPRPATNEPYVRYDVSDQAWVTWNAFLVQKVGVNPRQGKPIAMVRSQPLVNVLEAPHMARMPMQRRSAIMEACGRACVEINVQDNRYAYRTFIEKHPYRREAKEEFTRLPMT